MESIIREDEDEAPEGGLGGIYVPMLTGALEFIPVGTLRYRT